MWDFIPFFESRRGLKRERGRKVSEKGRAEETGRKEPKRGAEKRESIRGEERPLNGGLLAIGRK